MIMHTAKAAIAPCSDDVVDSRWTKVLEVYHDIDWLLWQFRQPVSRFWLSESLFGRKKSGKQFLRVKAACKA